MESEDIDDDGGTVTTGRIVTAVVVGVPALVIGLGIGVPHLAAGVTSTGVLAAVLLVVGMALLVLSGVAVWRATRWHGRLGLVVVALLLAQFVVLPATMAVFATNRAPMPLPAVTPAAVGLDHRDVTLTTEDGVALAAWYVPSTNGAAVVLRHGSGSTRATVLDHARVLADHGFGVLMVDARGHGDSEGHEMDFGWYGDADIAPAVGYLADAPDVADGRIAVVGLSMGGEEAIGAAASDPRIRVVVGEGVTGRTGDDWLPLRPTGVGRIFSRAFYWVQDHTAALLTDAPRPVDLGAAVAAIAPRPVLLVAAGQVPEEITAARRLQAAAPTTVEVWEADGAGHVGALRTAPDVWERRVVAFIGDALGVDAAG